MNRLLFALCLLLAASGALAQSASTSAPSGAEAAPPPAPKSLNLNLDAASMRQLNSGVREPARDARKKDDNDRLLPSLGHDAVNRVETGHLRSGSANPFPKDTNPGY